MEKNINLYIRNIEIKAGSKKILKNINLSLYPGEFCGLIGPSGSGKSTLIKALLGLRMPSKGTVRIGTKEVSQAGPVGYVPQEDALHTSLRVDESLDYAAMLRLPKLRAKQRVRHIRAITRKLGLEEHAGKRIKHLSGGQRKRVSVALELLTQPPVLILDEPTSGLDPGMEARMMQLFKQVAGKRRIVLVSTHTMQSLSLCDAVILLMDGYMIYFAHPNQLQGYFNVERHEDIFHQLSQRSADEWQFAFKNSKIAGKFKQRPIPENREEKPGVAAKNGREEISEKTIDDERKHTDKRPVPDDAPRAGKTSRPGTAAKPQGRSSREILSEIRAGRQRRKSDKE